jgi:hypothetical protein
MNISPLMGRSLYGNLSLPCDKRSLSLQAIDSSGSPPPESPSRHRENHYSQSYALRNAGNRNFAW